MALNIKNSEAEQAVRDLAATTGETQAEAVLIATRERLQRLTQDDRRARLEMRAQRLQAALRNSGARLDSDFLYDESGLPR